MSCLVLFTDEVESNQIIFGKNSDCIDTGVPESIWSGISAVQVNLWFNPN